MYYAQQEKLFKQYYIVQEEVYKEGVVFAVRKNDEELGKIMNKAIYKLRNSDILYKLQQKWFLKLILEQANHPEEKYIWAVQITLGLLLLIGHLLYSWSNKKTCFRKNKRFRTTIYRF